jgi:hypothetical protein
MYYLKIPSFANLWGFLVVLCVTITRLNHKKNTTQVQSDKETFYIIPRPYPVVTVILIVVSIGGNKI